MRGIEASVPIIAWF